MNDYRSLKKLLNCQKLAILMFDADWLTHEANLSTVKLPYYKFAVEGETILQLVISEKDVMEPAFTTLIDI